MFKSFRHVAVRMQPWEIEHALTVGGKRLVANLDRGNALHYKSTLMESDWIAQPAAVLCEAAVAKFLGVYYDWSAWSSEAHHLHRAAPDLPGVEVRRMRTHPRPTVRWRDVEKNVDIYPAYISMDDPREVLVYGGAPASQCWFHGKPAAYDSTGKSRTFPLSVVSLPEVAHV